MTTETKHSDNFPERSREGPGLLPLPVEPGGTRLSSRPGRPVPAQVYVPATTRVPATT
ncbi:hypothetical protein [Frankia sp. CiP1_Cm_nod2]|uniref:hypothetical protein n=1 Tax=Frankia sp. CiP1_Cm_nod2 TaxID=2897161 RepID=UPI002024AF44